VSVYLIVFGAAVREGGGASGTLRRRCELAAAYRSRFDSSYVVATGGQGRHGPPEAHVMRDLLLQAGVPAGRILIENQARDTLQSVRWSARILRGRTDVDSIVVCSSGYHAPRCVLLFRLLGFRASAAPADSDRRHLGTMKWLRYVAKEALAMPLDGLVLLVLRAFGTA
jgi:uncharacterized SAM-binding protein YcdF (DUF218 family)